MREIPLGQANVHYRSGHGLPYKPLFSMSSNRKYGERTALFISIPVLSKSVLVHKFMLLMLDFYIDIAPLSTPEKKLADCQGDD